MSTDNSETFMTADTQTLWLYDLLVWYRRTQILTAYNTQSKTHAIFFVDGRTDVHTYWRTDIAPSKGGVDLIKSQPKIVPVVQQVMNSQNVSHFDPDFLHDTGSRRFANI